MKKERKISNTLSRKLAPYIIALVEKDFSVEEISEGLNLSVFRIKRILDENNIEITQPIITKVIKPRQNEARNKEILELLHNNESYVSIGKKYNISKQRVKQIANFFGYDRMLANKEKIQNLITQINIDVEAGLKYKDISVKYSLTSHLKAKLAYYGLPLFTQLLEQRKNLVVNEYKSKIARKVLESDVQGIHNPFELRNINRVYTISSKMGYKRYPKIGKRCEGGLQENLGILEIIKHKRDKEKMSFSKIANHLNESGYLTISDKTFTQANTRFKYLYYTGTLKPIKEQKKLRKIVDLPIDKPANKKIILKIR
jgi:hypothetical protein